MFSRFAFLPLGLVLITAIHCTFSNLGIDVHPSTLRYFHSDELNQQSISDELPIDARDELQRDIRRALDLPPRPKRSVSYHKREAESAIEYLERLYVKLKLELESDDNDSHGSAGRRKRAQDEVGEADTIVTFKNQIRRMRYNEHLRHHPRRRFWFNVSDVPARTEVLDVELRLYRDSKLSHLNGSQPIQMSLYSLSYGLSKHDVSMDLVHSYNMSSAFDGWFKFNVTLPFIKWIRYPQQNLGLYLQIRQVGETKDFSPKMLGIVNANRGQSKYQPFLIAFTKYPPGVRRFQEEIKKEDERLEQQKSASRSRRETLGGSGTRTRPKKRSDLSYYDHDSNNPYLSAGKASNNNNCHKEHLFVSFRELEWEDWIIQPHGYTAWYCSGECTFPLENNATGHAIMQTLMHVMNPETVKKPCCIPTQLAPIMVLYFDDHANVVLRKYSKMVVKSCGCN